MCLVFRLLLHAADSLTNVSGTCAGCEARRWPAPWEVDVQRNGGLDRLPTEFAISKQNGSRHVYRTSIPDVGNILGALVLKSLKIEKISFEILVQ